MTRVGYVGLGYILAVILAGLNVVLASFGPPAPHLTSLIGTGGPGAPGLAVLAALAVPVAIVCGVWGDLNGMQWRLVGAAALWTTAPALSMTLHGSLRDGRFWSVAFIACGLAISAAAIPVPAGRRLLLGLGWLFGWGSVLAGLADLLFGWPVVLIGGDDRFPGWLAVVGIHVDEVSSLNGLLGGRIFVGMTCGLLFVYAVRALMGRRGWVWLMPAGLLIAIAWSLARAGLLAVVVGLVAALVPWQRWRSVWAYLVLLLTMVTSLVVLSAVGPGALPKGTLRWRVELWHTYLSRPGALGPFGFGPVQPPDPITGHAHNQLLESQATGGWLGVAGLLAFMLLACAAALRASDNRAALAVVFGAAAIYATDVLSFAPAFAAVNQAFVVLMVAVMVAARARTPHRTAASDRSP